MPTKNAPLCKKCGIRRTNNAFGLCSICKDGLNLEVPLCKNCHKVHTRSQSGLCKNCISKNLGNDTPENINAAIVRHKLRLSVLSQRKGGVDIAEIAKNLGISEKDVLIIIRNASYSGTSYSGQTLFGIE